MSFSITDAGELLTRGELPARLRRDCDFVDFAHMPPPGASFVHAATQLSPSLASACNIDTDEAVRRYLKYLYFITLYCTGVTLPIVVKGSVRNCRTLPGHAMCEPASVRGGPRPARVMVVCKQPTDLSVSANSYISEPKLQPLLQALDDLIGPDVYAEWYITGVVKWAHIDGGSASLPQAYVKDCAILLEQELRLVRPDFVLCLGVEAIKAVTQDKNLNITAMAGRVVERQIPLTGVVDSETGDTASAASFHTVKIMGVTSPSVVYSSPDQYENFAQQLSSFVRLTRIGSLPVVEPGVQHVNVYTEWHLAEIVESIRNDRNTLSRIIAVDCEWNGEHPSEDGSYLRTVQFSAADFKAYTVVLRYDGGEEAFVPSIDHAIPLLRRLLLPDPEAGYFPRVGGHLFRADLPWLIHAGVDCRNSYAPPAELKDCRDYGGWDTSLMHVAVCETASFALTDMLLKLTAIPRYDIEIDEWRKFYCQATKTPSKKLGGYGAVPVWLLHPDCYHGKPHYAGYDVDGTRRLAVQHMQPGGLLDADVNGNSSWEAYFNAHRASLGFLQMELTGITLDKERVDGLTVQFMTAYQAMLTRFREMISWPGFNPESPQHCVAFLFGDEFCRKIDKTYEGVGIRYAQIRPEGATCLRLTPIKATGKPAKLWEDVIAAGRQHMYSPATDKEVLGILGHSSPLAMYLRDLRFVKQVIKSALRPPSTDDDGAATMDESGHFEYEDGLPSYVCRDGRVRTHMSQLKETGRSSSYRPPLQNLSKRREDDYRRILGAATKNSEGVMVASGGYLDVLQYPRYTTPLRSIFKAAPGTVLLDVDFKGAELAMLAWMSGDAVMIDHVSRNNLPESDPNFFDIHSQMAVRAFNLSCPPTKKGLVSIGRPGLRVAAKNVVFGVPYGRQAPAIRRQCREEGQDITDNEAQQLIDMYFETYPDVGSFLASCRRRATQDGFLYGCFGRCRRFARSSDRRIIGEQERQAQNFPIQNGVADAMNLAIFNLYCEQQRRQLLFRLLLQVHDSLLLEVPFNELRLLLLGDDSTPPLLHDCMVTRVPVYPRALDGTPLRVARPYHFGIDVELFLNWGVGVDVDSLVSAGMSSDDASEILASLKS